MAGYGGAWHGSECATGQGQRSGLLRRGTVSYATVVCGEVRTKVG